jgi:L-ascorbate metabolism protein UlaG (beta-lactamase superfamily)
MGGDVPVRVTYIANAGFLIEAGGGRILIDAIFNDRTISYSHVPDDGTLGKIVAAEPPFDGVDLVLVTHRHRDHFAAEPVKELLDSNQEALLIAPPQAVAQLGDVERFGDRIRPVNPDLHRFETITTNDIRVKAYRLNHSAYMETDPETGKERNRHAGVQNLAYVVELAGRSFLHTGDAVFSQSLELFEDNRFEKREIDIVFMEYFDWSEETAQVLEDWMTPDHIVFMHLPPDTEKIDGLAARLKERFPQAHLFREPMQTREF